MDIKSVFELLRHLSSQTNVKDLTVALTELLVAHFSGVQVVVYEVLGGRIDESKRNCIVGLDCLQNKPPIYLHQHPTLLDAYQTKEELYDEEGDRHRIIIPVELYDTNVSHVIVATHPYKEGGAFDLLTGLLRIFTDIFRNLHEKGYDPLTRILNRQAYDQTVTKLAYAHSNQSVSSIGKNYSAIAILDIDKFKDINDKHGHAIGDETLVLFAQTVRSVLRQEDMFFRYGGEEFVVFVTEVDFDQAQSILERCRQAIESRRFPQVEHVTVSIGYSKLDPAKEHPSDSLSKADKALYYIKQHGRNQVKSYDQLVAMDILKPIEVQQGSADFW